MIIDFFKPDYESTYLLCNIQTTYKTLMGQVLNFQILITI